MSADSKWFEKKRALLPMLSRESGCTYAVYDCLFGRIKDDNSWAITFEEIATEVGCSERSVTRAVSRLRKLGLIATQQAKKQRTIFTLSFPIWGDKAVMFVFCGPTGALLQRSNVLQRIHYPALEAAKLPRITFHDLRHTAATMLLGLGVHPKVAQERLGHSSIKTTLDRYSHAVPTMQESTVIALDERFGKRGA